MYPLQLFFAANTKPNTNSMHGAMGKEETFWPGVRPWLIARASIPTEDEWWDKAEKSCAAREDLNLKAQK